MKKSSVLVVVLILAIVGLIVPLYFEGYVALGENRLTRFSSYEQLKSFLKERAQSYRYYLSYDTKGAFLLTPNSLESNGKFEILPSTDYSKTNVQVEGVDEADIVKTDGEYIYIASGKNITILKAHPPEEAEILSQITLNGTISGVFINENRMVIFESDGGYNLYYYATLATPVKSYPYYGAPMTSIRVYDVSNRASPKSMRNVTLDGNYFDSRMIGDYVYAVINEGMYANETWVSLPRIYSNGEIEEISAREIYYSDVSDYFNTFTTIVAINTQNDAQEPTRKTILLGATSNMYVSMNNIYITFQEYSEKIRLISPIQFSRVYEWGTTICRVHIEYGEIEIGPSGQVPGNVLNQFSMDEYNGYFRIATTSWGEGVSLNHVYVLDMDLNIVGRLENLALGENIHSARFMGNRCYLVTFKKIDPLFVIDLTDPSAPVVLGELEMPGYSDYLHPYDENHIIGVGKETVEGEGGNFAWYQGIKIALFDVSDVEHPQEMDKYIIGDRGSDSPILSDHKAFLFDRAKSLLVIPVLVAEIDEAKYPNGVPPWTYGDFVFQGAYVFNMSLSGFELKGTITHLHAMGLGKSGFYLDSSYYVERSLYIDNVLYTISAKKIKMNSLEDLNGINEIEIP
jgi:uncharacterized secreted protein with C-terminal beta-propeller domain